MQSKRPIYELKRIAIQALGIASGLKWRKNGVNLIWKGC